MKKWRREKDRKEKENGKEETRDRGQERRNKTRGKRWRREERKIIGQKDETVKEGIHLKKSVRLRKHCKERSREP